MVLTSLQRSLADRQFLCLLRKGISASICSLPPSSDGASWPEFALTGPDPGRHLPRSLLQLESQWITPRLPWGLTGFPDLSPEEAGEGRVSKLGQSWLWCESLGELLEVLG